LSDSTGRSDTAATAATPAPLVWDWPLRLWHWLFALCVAGSLTTGLLGDISLMDWHMRLGHAAIGLLLFRVGWALWGARYARWHAFGFSPARFRAFLHGESTRWVRTAPGALLVLAMLVAVAVQAGMGLFTTDDIFTNGPLVRHASRDTVSTLSSLHRQFFWVVIVLIGVHLTAHLIYGLLRNPTPLGMFTGRRPFDGAPIAGHHWLRALLTAAAAAGAVWWALGAA
jgi:cytochrome b